MAISWLCILLQVVCGSVASFLAGMLWFSPFCMGRIWWRSTFPNKKFGEGAGQSLGAQHILCTCSYIVQSAVIAWIINTLSAPKLLPLFSETLPLPLVCASVISVLVAMTTYPHYVYADKPTILYLTCVGYDVVQVTVATLAIYFIAEWFN